MVGAILVSILDRNIKVNKSKDSNLFKLGILNMIALMLHNFPEGIATFMTSYSDLSIRNKHCCSTLLFDWKKGEGNTLYVYICISRASWCYNSISFLKRIY